ncbi:MAG: phosphoribosyltransferase [Acidobacteria bacterium]|nr:phosphoribosyltransferase [Acidobacteriota bacterium]
MQLIPTQDEVIQLLRDTGALRDGFFAYPNGLYSNQYLQMALALRHYSHQRLLSVALSRLVRRHSEIRASISQLSIVAPAVAGLPVAYGVCEALRARQVYWAERINGEGPRFRQFLDQVPGERVLLVDDVMRSGKNLAHIKKLCEESGAEVMGIATIVSQPNPDTVDFGDLPRFHLATIDSIYYGTEDQWPNLAPGQEPVRIWV